MGNPPESAQCADLSRAWFGLCFSAQDGGADRAQGVAGGFLGVAFGRLGVLELCHAKPRENHSGEARDIFQSMARDLGTGAMGVLLTGMGDDGAVGLLAVRRAGGYVIAEDESTAAVYEMPAAAVRMEAVCESLPVTATASGVLDLVSCKVL